MDTIRNLGEYDVEDGSEWVRESADCKWVGGRMWMLQVGGCEGAEEGVRRGSLGEEWLYVSAR